MKTLVRPQEKSITELPLKKFSNQNKLSSLNNQYRKSQGKLKLTILILSFSIFILFPEAPEKSASSCLRFNSNLACSIW